MLIIHILFAPSLAWKYFHLAEIHSYLDLLMSYVTKKKVMNWSMHEIKNKKKDEEKCESRIV